MTKKLFHLVLIVLFSKFYTQRNDRFVFHSSPSFHNGFSVELLDGNILRFTTNNNYYVLNSLKPEKNDLPTFYFEDNKLSENKNLLPNSSFEATLDHKVKESFVEEFSRLADLSKKVGEEKFGYDGIIFMLDRYDGQPVKIWSPDKSSIEGSIILDFLDYLKRLYRPNSIVDKYLFESRFYVDEENVFEVINDNPLFIRFYDLSFSFLNCSKLEDKIDDLPNSELIYIDFSQVKHQLNVDVKKCFVDEINKKFKQVKLIQTEETGQFNMIK